MAIQISPISLTLPAPGFYSFISAWIFEHQHKLFVVDPGPANSLSILYEALGDRKPDYILLTHIHVDHAGGIGQLSKKFPQAKIIAHEKAHRHLVDPARLIEGSRKTLDSLMDLYGEIVPVREDAILDSPQIEGLSIIETPGHAPHHISFITENLMFCGEALGVVCPVGSDSIYLRPATPPIFNLEAYKSSIEKLEKNYKNQQLCFGHYGSGVQGVSYFQKAKDQIELWLKIVKSRNLSPDPLRLSSEQLNELINILILEDRDFKNFTCLLPEIQERERLFIANSIKGLI